MIPMVCDVHDDHRERVADVRDPAELVAELGRGPGVRGQPLGRCETDEQLRLGNIVPGSVGWVITATTPYYTLTTDDART